MSKPELTPELRDYYDQLFGMIATPGWKYLLEDVEAMRKTYEDIRHIPDGNALLFRKGQIDILEWVLGLKDRLDEAYRQLTEGEP
jgi:hypothetical protein